MSQVSFTVGFASTPFPAGTAAPASLSLVITQPDGTTVDQTLAVDATTASATVTQTGAYTASLQALDASNTPVGEPVSASFSVDASGTGTGGGTGGGTSVSFSIPSTLTASVS